MKRCKMLAVSGEKGWNTRMSPPFMLRLGKSVFAVGLADQCCSILRFAFFNYFYRPFSGYSQTKFQGIFKNPFAGAPRTVRKSRQLAKWRQFNHKYLNATKLEKLEKKKVIQETPQTVK